MRESARAYYVRAYYDTTIKTYWINNNMTKIVIKRWYSTIYYLSAYHKYHDNMQYITLREMKSICYKNMCQVSIIACIYNQVNTNQHLMSYVKLNFVINYVSVHRLRPIVNTSQITPTTYVN